MSSETIKLPSGREIEVTVPTGGQIMGIVGNGHVSNTDVVLALAETCTGLARGEIENLPGPDFFAFIREMQRISGVHEAMKALPFGKAGTDAAS